MSQENDPERQPEHIKSGSVRWLFPEIEDEALEREHSEAIMEQFRRRIQSNDTQASETEVIPEEELGEATGAATSCPRSTPTESGNGRRQRRLRRRGHRR